MLQVMLEFSRKTSKLAREHHFRGDRPSAIAVQVIFPVLQLPKFFPKFRVVTSWWEPRKCHDINMGICFLILPSLPLKHGEVRLKRLLEQHSQ